MSHRDSEEEKLIEEISDQLSTYLLEDTDTEQLFEIPNEEYWAFLKSLITRILKAAARGELELPGEAGRGGAWRDKKNPRFRFVGDDSENPSGWRLENARIQSFKDLYDVDMFRLIALSGTGKEEE